MDSPGDEDSAQPASAGAAGSTGAAPRPFHTEDDLRRQRRLVGVQDIVDGLMNKIGGGKAAAGARLSAAWEEIVGPEFMSRTKPGSCDSGRLVVLVTDGATASKLRFMTTQIMERAAKVVGEGVVDRISFRVTPGLRQ